MQVMKIYYGDVAFRAVCSMGAFFCVWLLLITQQSIAQPRTVVQADSLETALRTWGARPADTAKIHLLNALAAVHRRNMPDKARRYALEALALAEHLGDKQSIADAFFNIGSTHYSQGEYEQALKYLFNAYQISQSIGYQKGSAASALQICNTYWRQGLYGIGLEYGFKALKVCEESGDRENYSFALIGIGNIYRSQYEYERATEYLSKALQYCQADNPSIQLASIYGIMSEIELAQGNFTRSLDYAHRGMTVNNQVGDKRGRFYGCYNLGLTHNKLQRYDSALVYFGLARVLGEELRHKQGLTKVYSGQAEVYTKVGAWSEAKSNAIAALSLADSIGAKPDKQRALQILADVYDGLHDYKRSAEYLRLAAALKDSLVNEENAKRAAWRETQFEAERKNQQIRLLQAGQQQQTIIRDALLGGVGALIVFATVLLWNNRQKKRANIQLQQQQELLEEQSHEIQTVNTQLHENNLQLESAFDTLKAAQSQLVHAEKMAGLGQLTAGVAHEINNPVTFITGALSPLQRDINDLLDVIRAYMTLQPANDEQRAAFAHIEALKRDISFDEILPEIQAFLRSMGDGAARITEIVKGLRIFSRLDEDVLKKANLHEGLEATLVILRSQYKDRIEIIRDYSTIPDVDCYPGQINQVLMNLLSNAVQAIEGTGIIRITTSVATTDVEGESVQISISDTGCGMSAEVQKRIFEPFFTTKDVGKGTGLGLSIAFGIIEKHYGAIAVTSKVGSVVHGTTFTIMLPVQQKQY